MHSPADVGLEKLPPPRTADEEGDNPFTQECEPSAKVWNLYQEKATVTDDRVVRTSGSDLDTLLIIVGSHLNNTDSH